ncbi:alpha/beta hydrolase [Candidatus Binatia bacterium]|nr:alpha/beta hydrolase [Candidatus Binatia bacterium]
MPASQRAVVLFVLAGLVLLAACAGCRMSALDRLIFFPERFMPAPPPGVAEQRFAAADGTRLHAWLAPPPDAFAPVLLWSHGNGGNVGGREDVLLALAARGLGVLAYDYRGYGHSEGQPDEAGVYRDADAAWQHLVAGGIAPQRIVCFGESLGGAVSIELATRRACAAVIVVSTFTSLRDVAREHYGALAALAGNQFDSAARVARLDVPILIAHGDRDEIVPFALGEALYARAGAPKRFLRVPGRQHNDVFDSPPLLDAIAAFAREAVTDAHASR